MTGPRGSSLMCAPAEAETVQSTSSAGMQHRRRGIARVMLTTSLSDRQHLMMQRVVARRRRWRIRPVSEQSAAVAVAKRVLDGGESLPGLPSLVFEIRRAIERDDVTVKKIAELVRNDPGLTALLFKYAASPIYRTRTQPTTLDGVISKLGFRAVSNIVLIHSVRGTFFAKSPQLRALYAVAWRRVIVRAGLACFLARFFNLHADDLLASGLLSDVGSLALLSALKTVPTLPDEASFVWLCRKYGKPVSVMLLRQWGIDPEVVQLVAQLGDWHETHPGAIDNRDVLNLALYHSLLWVDHLTDLPPLASLALYEKIAPDLAAIGADGGLVFLADHRAQIEEIILSLGGAD